MASKKSPKSAKKQRSAKKKGASASGAVRKKKTAARASRKKATPKKRSGAVKARKTAGRKTATKKAARKAVKKTPRKAAGKAAKKKIAKKKAARKTVKKVAKKKTGKKVGKKTVRKAAKKPAPRAKATPKPAKVRPAAKLPARDLRRFRELLLAKRAELAGDVTTLQNEALNKNRQDAAGDLSSMPIHMADLGSDNYEKEFTLGLIEGERELLRQIDDALARIKDGTYGICEATGRAISKARLNARPWAKYCYEYVLAQERGQHGEF